MKRVYTVWFHLDRHRENANSSIVIAGHWGLWAVVDGEGEGGRHKKTFEGWQNVHYLDCDVEFKDEMYVKNSLDCPL